MSDPGSNIAYNTITVLAASATLVVAGRTLRKSVLIQNTDGTNPIYVGDSSVSSTTGLKVVAGASLELDDYNGPVYARASGANVDARYLEVY
jgi:hypothetical protein